MPKLTTVVNFKTTLENKERINNLAKKTNHSAAFLYNYLLNEYLDDVEDIFLGEQALDEIRSEKMKTVLADDLYKELS